MRHYSPTRWVSTDAEAYFMGVGAAMAFRRLFQYITGANEGGGTRREPGFHSMCVLFFACTDCVVGRRRDGDDCACAGQNPGRDQDVGASYLHAQLPAACSLSGQAAPTHQR